MYLCTFVCIFCFSIFLLQFFRNSIWTRWISINTTSHASLKQDKRISRGKNRISLILYFSFQFFSLLFFFLISYIHRFRSLSELWYKNKLIDSKSFLDIIVFFFFFLIIIEPEFYLQSNNLLLKLDEREILKKGNDLFYLF